MNVYREERHGALGEEEAATLRYTILTVEAADAVLVLSTEPIPPACLYGPGEKIDTLRSTLRRERESKRETPPRSQSRAPTKRTMDSASSQI